MSDWDEKIEQAEARPEFSTRARCFLRKHLTWSDGSPRYSIIREDSSGPVIIKTQTMDEAIHLWRRVYFERNDILYEAVLPNEEHESYFANPRQEVAKKAKRIGAKRTKKKQQ